MTLKLIASNAITLTDLNDAIITGTAPSNPTTGTLWIDSSQSPNVLKEWNGSSWVTQSLSLQYLDNTQYTNLQNNISAINSMSNDLIITQSERISVKDQIQQMVGSVPSDTYTLPAIATIDGSSAGQLYQTRKAALNAGISTSNSDYTALGNAYTTLANYLNGLSPLPWNTTSTANITITSTWRTNWNTYYAALYQLQQDTLKSTQTYVQSRGQNLVTNGTGLLGNNTNFSAFTFDGSDSYFSKGSFKDSTYNSTRQSDEIMPVDVNKTYRLTAYAKANPYISGAHAYIGISEWDADGLQITSQNHMYIANTLTTLATALNPGDTVINLTSATNWQNAAGASSQNRSIIFWNYVNASGYAWPAQTYSRNYSASDLWADGSVNFTTNQITLRSAWTGSTIPSGTQVSNGSAGGTYKYIAAGNVNIPNTWTQYTGTIGGVDNTGTNATSNFSYGTAGVKLLFLNNRDVTGNTTWYSDISFNIDVASQGSVDTINTTLSNMANDSIITQSERIDVKNTVTNIIGYVPTDTQSLPASSTLDSGGKGEFWGVRVAATNAGLSTGDANYTTFANNYTTLANYLNGMSPKPWDVTSTGNLNITASTWRTNWYNYYDALYKLQQAIQTAVTNNITNSTAGGRNYIKNTYQLQDLTNWSLSAGSAIAATLNVVNDSIYGGVIDLNVTTNSATGNNWIVIQNTGLTLPNGKFVSGNTYTVSFLIWTALNMYVNFRDANGSNPVASNSPTIPVNSGWTKFSYTFTATATGNTPELYLAATDTTHTGHVYVTQVMLQDGSVSGAYNPAPEDTTNAVASLQTRMYNAEQKITDTAITNTVTKSVQYTTDMSSKANSSDLSNYATNDAVTQAQSNAQSYTDKQINAIDFSPYATNSQLTQTSQNLTMAFSNSGGVNILQNSVGYSSTDYWTVTGTVATTQDPALSQFGALSGFVLTGGTLAQTVTITPNIAYTLSVIVKKGTAGTGYMQMSDGTSTQTSNFVSGTAYNYQAVSINLTPATGSLTITLNGDSASGGVTFSCVMLNVGSNAFTWQQHMGEVYNSNINFDSNGIRVAQTDANGKLTGYTVMTPTKFAGYTDQNNDGVIDQTTGSVDEVFRMDKDTFVMKSATIAPIKIVPLTSGGYNGIAFIPSS